MVTKAETAELLRIAGKVLPFFEATADRVEVWHALIAGADLDRARERLYDWLQAWDGKRQLAPRDLLGYIPDRAADARVARARGIVAADWDTSRRLPADAQQRLDAARREERERLRIEAPR